MPMPTRLLILSAVVLMVGACTKEPVDLPATSTDTSPATVSTVPPVASPSSDASLPSATTVFAADPAASAASAGALATIQPNATLTDAQEKTSMPLGGQTDNHSAPKVTDKTASAP